MSADPRARRRQFATTVVAITALAVVVALLTACGSSSGDKAAPAAGLDQARKYAQCIRDNGVPDFPDPDAEGRFRGPSHEQANNPRFQAAQQKCRALAPGGTHENQIGNPAFVKQAREFAQCIRNNGVPDFPDPGPDGTFRGASHEQQGDRKFQAALQACRAKLPGSGGHQGF